MKHLLAGLLTMMLSATAHAACSDPSQRALDFWVGDWDVTNAKGALVGRSHVERAFGGCVIVENYKGVNGGYAGMSLNTYEPVAKQWSQHWVDNGGLSVVMTGGFEEKNLVYRREFTAKDGKATLSRMTFFDQGKESVRQLVEQSVDGGAKWATIYDMRYARRKS